MSAQSHTLTHTERHTHIRIVLWNVRLVLRVCMLFPLPRRVEDDRTWKKESTEVDRLMCVELLPILLLLFVAV